MSEVRIEVLGPVRAHVDGVEQRVGGRRERVVLGLLAASAGRPVPVERLVDTLWGEEPPASAQGSLQVAVSRLRTMLAPGRRPGEAPVISHSPAGYALVEAEVDATELSAAASAVVGRGPAEVAELTEAALALWQGEPYADLRGRGRRSTPRSTRLHEDRLRLLRGTHRRAARPRAGTTRRRPMLATLVGGEPVPGAALVAARGRALPLRPAGGGAGDAAPPADHAGRRARRRPVPVGAHPRGGPARPGPAPGRAGGSRPGHPGRGRGRRRDPVPRQRGGRSLASARGARRRPLDRLVDHGTRRGAGADRRGRDRQEHALGRARPAGPAPRGAGWPWAAATRRTSRRRTGPGCRCCARSPDPTRSPRWRSWSATGAPTRPRR